MRSTRNASSSSSKAKPTGRRPTRSTAMPTSRNSFGFRANWSSSRTGWSRHKLKVVVIFEGRDAAGKGGVIKRITHRLNPRVCRVVALPAPSERERTQWYFQRYVTHLPAGGEIVLFDRSWYNRAGVERVMGFCSEADGGILPLGARVRTHARPLRHHSRQILVLDHRRRAAVPLHDANPGSAKQWKLSPMDVESRRRWEDYTKAKEAMSRSGRTSPRRAGGWSRRSTRNGPDSNWIRLTSSRQIPLPGGRAPGPSCCPSACAIPITVRLPVPGEYVRAVRSTPVALARLGTARRETSAYRPGAADIRQPHSRGHGRRLRQANGRRPNSRMR